MLTRMVDMNGYFAKQTMDERGRIVKESYPMTSEGKWMSETEATTFEYEYENEDRTPIRYRHRGWTEGCFWTDWEDYRD